MTGETRRLSQVYSPVELELSAQILEIANALEAQPLKFTRTANFLVSSNSSLWRISRPRRRRLVVEFVASD